MFPTIRPYVHSAPPLRTKGVSQTHSSVSGRTPHCGTLHAMTTMISEVHDALLSAGAPEDKARKAAEAIANYENRFNRIEGELMLLKWMMGFNLAFTLAILWKIFS